MNNKYLLGTAVAAALMFGAQAASACAISAWSSATGLTAADTGEPPAGFKRYSGRCSLQVPNASTPRFVTDTTPNDETSYRVRFYYFTGNITGAVADIFQARNTVGTNIIRVTHDGTQLVVSTTAGTPATITVADNRYYAIELAWTASATGSLTGTVTGNSGTAAAPAQAGVINITGINNAADRITEARMGLIAGTPTVTSAVFFDEFDSRRTQNPGRLCRGDAASPLNNTVNVFDAVAVINDASGNPAQLSAGQPDVNDDGVVNVFDAVGVVTIAGSAFAACP
jgi:hypothetical protein